MTFKALCHCIQILPHDCFFLVGSSVVRRKSGYPMGGSFSEVGTCIDLNYAIDEARSDKALMNKLGISYKNLTFDNILAVVGPGPRLCRKSIFIEFR